MPQMSRRKQVNPQHLPPTEVEHQDDPRLLSSHHASCFSIPVASRDPSLVQVLSPNLQPDPDLLTCGQCQTTFPLEEILLFIQHKKKLCQRHDDKSRDSTGGAGSGRGSQSLRTDGAELRKVVDLVEVSIQSPPEERMGREERKEREKRMGREERKEREERMGREERKERDERMGREERKVRGERMGREERKERDERKEREEKTTPRGLRLKQEITATDEPSSYICTTCKQDFTSAWFLLQHVQNFHHIRIYLDSNSSSAALTPRLTRPPCSSGDSPQNYLGETNFHLLRMTDPLLRAVPPGFWESTFPDTPAFFSPPSCQHLDNPTPLESQSMDFSRRLRELAVNTSHPVSPSRGNPLHHLLYPNSVLPGTTPPYCNSPPSQIPLQCNPQQTQNKNKSCEFCGKTFKFQSNLVVHRRSHTGEKPYKCQLCEHACSQASKLKRHMKTHKDSSLTEPSNDGLSSSPEPETSEVSDQLMKDQDGGSSDEGHNEEEEEEHHSGQESNSSLEFVRDMKIKRLTVEKIDREINSIQDYSRLLDNHNMIPLSKEFSHDRGLSREEDSGALNHLHLHHHHQEERTTLSGSSDSFPMSLFPYKSEPSPGYNKIKLEKDSDVLAPPNIPSENVYSQWLVGYAASRHFIKDPFLGFIDSRESPFTAPSEHSSENGSLCFSTPPEDLLDSQSIFSGGSTPRLGGGPARPGSKDTRRCDTCEFCGKVFKNCSNLTVHRRSHTGERPYKCALCSYACAQSSKLTRHMKTHGQSGKEVFRCHVCHMPFSVSGTLEKHMKKWHIVEQRGED